MNREAGAFDGDELRRLAGDQSATNQPAWILLVEDDFAMRKMVASYLVDHKTLEIGRLAIFPEYQPIEPDTPKAE